MNNSEESNGNNKTNINNDLNNLYNRYFANPKNIDQVYNKPKSRPYLAGGIIGGFIYDKNNAHMHDIEKAIQQVYYRLPSLSFPAFFDVKNLRPDLQKGRAQEIKEIYDAAKMILSDIDSLKNIDTKKRILYYFKTLVNATKGCEISKKISDLVITAEQRNHIIIPNIVNVMVAEKRKEFLTK